MIYRDWCFVEGGICTQLQAAAWYRLCLLILPGSYLQNKACLCYIYQTTGHFSRNAAPPKNCICGSSSVLHLLCYSNQTMMIRRTVHATTQANMRITLCHNYNYIYFMPRISKNLFYWLFKAEVFYKASASMLQWHTCGCHPLVAVTARYLYAPELTQLNIGYIIQQTD